MPIKKSKKKFTMRTLCLVLFAIAVLNILSFVSDGEWRNTFIFVGVGVMGLIGLVSIVAARSRQRACAIYTRATVRDIVTQGTTTILRLEYSVMGQAVSGSVQYYEKELPVRGQDVGVYYSELCPTDCVLKIYKEHPVGWSKRTRKDHCMNLLAFIGFTAFFFGMGCLMVHIVSVRTAEYSETALGTVVGYDAQFDSHTVGVPGTYEYSPFIQLEVDGITYTAKALALSLSKGYPIGEVLTVHYAPGSPETVIIEGDKNASLVTLVFFFLGLCTAWVAVIEMRNLRHCPKNAPERIQFI